MEEIIVNIKNTIERFKEKRETEKDRELIIRTLESCVNELKKQV